MGVKTNREKFIEVFGINPIRIDEIDWDKPYAKCKTYHALLTGGKNWGSDRIIGECYIQARSLKEARAMAIDVLGNKYKRYVGSNKPMHKLTIERWKDDSNTEYG